MAYYDVDESKKAVSSLASTAPIPMAEKTSTTTFHQQRQNYEQPPAAMTTPTKESEIIVEVSAVPTATAVMMNNQAAVRPDVESATRSSIPTGVAVPVSDFQPLNLLDMFALHLVLGLFGATHFRMGRYGLGWIYFFTVGGFGMGYLVDWFRMKSLVDEYNAKQGKLLGNESDSTILGDCYALWVTGILGIPHFYMNRTGMGLYYLCTCGCFGMGMLFDLFRMNILVKDYIAKKEGTYIPPVKDFSLSDAYVFWFPLFGLLGAHHLYLKNTPKFFLYFFTFGLFGIGWIVDGFRMSCLVHEANEKSHFRNAKEAW